MIEHTFFLPNFTAATDEKYFSGMNFFNEDLTQIWQQNFRSKKKGKISQGKIAKI